MKHTPVATTTTLGTFPTVTTITRTKTQTVPVTRISEQYCIDALRPAFAGEVLITELMPSPVALGDAQGEWVELYNPTGAPVLIGGCFLTDGGAEAAFLDPSLVIEPGQFLLLSRGPSPGVQTDGVYGDDLDLAQEDTVQLKCPNGTQTLTVSSVAYSAINGFTTVAGSSIALAPSVYGSPNSAFRFASGADGRLWCAGTDDYNGDLGSPALANPTCAPPSLLFSEYIEGLTVIKAIELWNYGALAVDSSICTLEFYAGADKTAPSSSFHLADLSDPLILPGEVRVFCSDRTPDPACDVNDGIVNFNGDDAVVLACNGSVRDSIGQTASTGPWTGGGVDTQNQTLRRSCTITEGDINPSDAFDPSVEWESAGTDVTEDLGVRLCF